MENGHLESFVDIELVTKGKSQKKDQRLILRALEFQETRET